MKLHKLQEMQINSVAVFLLILFATMVFSQCKKEKEEPLCNNEATVTIINETSNNGIYIQINAGSVQYIENKETLSFIVDFNETSISANLTDGFTGWEEKVYNVNECDHITSSWYDSDFSK